MENNVKHCLFFVGGLIIGAFCSYEYVTKKMSAEKEDLLINIKDKNDRINELKEKLNSILGSDAVIQKEHELDKENTVKNENEDKENTVQNEEKAKINYNTIIKNVGYNKDGESTTESPSPERYSHSTVEEEISIISSDEFQENEEYECVNLTYYQDEILADESDDSIIESPEQVVGEKALLLFRDSEDDVIYVRNDKTQTYYEILRDYRDYSFATGRENPYDD